MNMAQCDLFSAMKEKGAKGRCSLYWSAPFTAHAQNELTIMGCRMQPAKEELCKLNCLEYALSSRGFSCGRQSIPPRDVLCLKGSRRSERVKRSVDMSSLVSPDGTKEGERHIRRSAYEHQGHYRCGCVVSAYVSIT